MTDRFDRRDVLKTGAAVGLGGLGFIAIAAIYAGGWQGWVLGVALLVFAVALGSWWWLRRDRDRRLPN